MTRHNHEAALASLNEIGQTLAELQAQQPKPEPETEPAEPHKQLAADLHAAQSKWFTWGELAGGGPMPRSKPTAHAELDHLRQQAAGERMKARDLEAQLEAAEDELEDAAQAISEGHAADDQKAVTAARQAEDEAVAAVKDLRHRFEGARLRVDRTQTELDTFLRERARDLLAEREPQARTVALELSRSVAETLACARAYIAERQAVDRLVAEVPGATPRTDGPAPEHPWEQALKELDRVYRDNPELGPALPQWTGLEHRRVQDDTHRLLNEARHPQRQEVA